MKPVYFPFTFINDSVARDLYAFFGQITVYQPGAHDIPENMQKLADEGVVELKVPVSGDEARIEALIKEYKEWGELHQKSDTAFLKAIGERVPFFDETFSTQLASQIKKIRDDNYSKEKPDILFNARLFLCLAQDYDLVQYGINRDLISVYEMEKKLLEGLTHEDEVFFSKKAGTSLQSDDYGKYKIKERIEAWTYLMSNDMEIPGFFITDSRDAFDFVMEKAGDIKEVINLASVPVSARTEIMNKWRNMFIGQVEGLLKDDGFTIDEKIYDLPAVKEHEVGISLKLLRITDKSRGNFINKILKQDFQDVMINNKNEKNQGIFICLAEPQ
ncbi:MAG: hypothetical protein EHM85_14890 [Desulfobacteraceae bacterium]|nr:MAG: hypothetical protein EHM85_14890 [Desulfobacteraceae bacterium]